MAEYVGQFKGLLSPASEEKWGEIGEELIQSDSKWIEMADGFASHQGIKALDNLLGEKVPDQEQAEVLANDFTDHMHDLIVNKNEDARDDVVDTGIDMLKLFIPAEKKIGQEMEDAIGQMLSWIINFLLDEFVFKQTE